jgi:hypothetical protein
MNVVGPLANPAMAGRQVVGVAEAHRVPLIAGALAALGSRHALVVHGAPGMDEVSPIGPTEVVEVRGGAAAGAWRIDPAAHGFAGIDAAELAGGEPADNAAVIEAVLAGGGRAGGARRGGAQRRGRPVRGGRCARLRRGGHARRRRDRRRFRRARVGAAAGRVLPGVAPRGADARTAAAAGPTAISVSAGTARPSLRSGRTLS